MGEAAEQIEQQAAEQVIEGSGPSCGGRVTVAVAKTVGADSIVLKTPPRSYWWRSADRWDWASIYIDDTTGTLAISSSFGSWAFTWGTHSIGTRTFHEFLATTYPDYVAGKLMPPQRRYVPSFTTTKKALMQTVLEERRGGHLDRDVARARWNELRDWDESDEHNCLEWTWPDYLHGDYYDCVREERTSETRNYEEVIHPIVVRCARGEVSS